MLRLGDPSPTLDAVRKLVPQIVAGADETEQKRAIPPPLVDGLREAGIFRMLVPKRFGGSELTEAQAVAVIEELASADAAAAWTAMVAFGFNVVLARFPRETVEEIYSGGPDVPLRGALAPIGTATSTKGGYIVSGRWPFASGPFKPKWIVAGCVVIHDGKPRMGPMGPETRVVVLPASSAGFLDTWHSVGLRGSDSCDFELKEAFVPEAFAVNLFDFSRPQVYGLPLFNLPFPLITAPTHSAVCLGIVRATLDELGVLARTKRSAFNPSQTMGEYPVFQHRFGELAARYAAIEALTELQVRDLMRMAAADEPASALTLSRNGTWVGYVHAQAVDIVNEAFSLAGSTPVYSKSPMQRRWRDVRVAAQHHGGSTAQYAVYGGMLAGQQPRVGL
jgi:alkylation response protein AidB-like acyl-CoA dehydrogenase